MILRFGRALMPWCLLLIFPTLLVANAPLLRGEEILHQICILDAGSSGTRIHIFHLYSLSNSDVGTHVPRVDLSVRSRQTKKVKPGLSSFAENRDVEGVRRNIRELMDFANQFVTWGQRSSTPVFLKATAGLRSVAQEKADSTLAVVRDVLKSSGYRFHDTWVDIIQGKEEGGLAWVAANYLHGTFDQEQGKDPIGVIEMGGGSTQVTFQVDPSEKVADSDEFVFATALGQRYRLYAHSYLGFGQDHARAHVTADMKGGTDPCYPKGYSRKGTVDGTFVNGEGNGEQCQSFIESALLSESDLGPGRYPSELPLKRGAYIATENFFYAQNDLSLGLEGSLVTPSLLASLAQKDCSKTWKGKEDFQDTCFAFSYQAALLKALKVDEQGVEVKIFHQVNGGDVDWALGAALIAFLEGHAAVGESWFSELALGAFAILLTAVSIIVFLRPKVIGKGLSPAKGNGVKPGKLGASANPME